MSTIGIIIIVNKCGLLLQRQAKPNHSGSLYEPTGLVFIFENKIKENIGEISLMNILKVINNNIVSALDDNNEEIIVMGKGLGFQTKAGVPITADKIEKIFRLNDQSETGKFKELLKAMPMEHIQISVEVIDYAKSILKNRMNPNIYITLTDHIDFAITRMKDGMKFPNPLLWEIKSYYPSEYLIGEYAVGLIRKELGVEFNADEAASIALHLVNAEYNTDMNNTMKITTLIGEVLDIVEEHIGMKLDEESLHYSRLITHLKFLVQRVFAGQVLNDDVEELSQVIKNMYPSEYECSQKIVEYIREKYQNCKISQDEMTYLAVHIRRINAELNKISE